MVDADGDKIGTIEAVLLDRQTGHPAADSDADGDPAIVGARLRPRRRRGGPRGRW
jgi:hypothetical protein